MEMKTENLKALIYGHELNKYQRAIAQKEWERVISRLDELEQLSIADVRNCTCRKPVECGNCGEEVVMVITGSVCPECYC